MGRLYWLIAMNALFAAGCMLCPGPNGTCRTSGPSSFIPPTARFNSAECPTSAPSKTVVKPAPYLTFSKYWPGMDEWATRQAARDRANNLLLRQQFQTLRWMPGSYKAGFRQAFLDIANGGDGSVPPVPPPKYWNAHYRSEYGQTIVAKWFDGYRAGSAMALIELDSIRQVGASYDWQVPARDAFAGADGCQPGGQLSGGCASGTCPTGAAGSCQIGTRNLGGLSPMVRTNGCSTCPQQAPFSDPYQQNFAGFQQDFEGSMPGPMMSPQPGYGQFQGSMSMPPQASVQYGMPPPQPTVPLGSHPQSSPRGQPQPGPRSSFNGAPPVGLQPGYSSGPTSPQPPTAGAPPPGLSPGYSSSSSGSPSALPPDPIAY